MEIRLGNDHISFEVRHASVGIDLCKMFRANTGDRLPRLDRSTMLRTRPTQKACASSTTSFRTSRRWCSVSLPCTSRSSPSNLPTRTNTPSLIYPYSSKGELLWHNAAFSKGVLFYLLAAQTGFLKLDLIRKISGLAQSYTLSTNRPTGPRT